MGAHPRGPRHTRGAHHVQRALGRRGPPERDRRGGLHQAQHPEGARAAEGDLRGGDGGPACACQHRRLRAREGPALRRPDRDGSGPAAAGRVCLAPRRARNRMPLRMARRRSTLAVCALALASSVGLSACESGAEKVRAGAEREGLAFPLGGIEYNVFITRELNPRITPDKAYFKGPEPRKDKLLYGIFLQACNQSEKPAQTAERFTVTDNQGNEFEPVELPRDNAFAYHQAILKPDQCIPEVGSVAQLGPTAGSMLLFELPLSNTENRPLELEIESPFDVTRAKRETRKVELDL